MTTTQKITVAALSLSGVVLGYAEVRALLDGRTDDTISEIIHDTALSQPIVGIAVGACAVHFAGGVPVLERAASRRPRTGRGWQGRSRVYVCCMPLLPQVAVTAERTEI